MSEFKNFAPPQNRITFRLAIRRDNQWFVVGKNDTRAEGQICSCCFEIEADDLKNIEIISFREITCKPEFLAKQLENYKNKTYFNSRRGNIEVFDFSKDSTLCML